MLKQLLKGVINVVRVTDLSLYEYAAVKQRAKDAEAALAKVRAEFDAYKANAEKGAEDILTLMDQMLSERADRLTAEFTAELERSTPYVVQ